MCVKPGMENVRGFSLSVCRSWLRLCLMAGFAQASGLTSWRALFKRVCVHGQVAQYGVCVKACMGIVRFPFYGRSDQLYVLYSFPWRHCTRGFKGFSSVHAKHCGTSPEQPLISSSHAVVPFLHQTENADCEVEWTLIGSCSVSCGVGVQQEKCTITKPAVGTGSCECAKTGDTPTECIQPDCSMS